MRVNCAPKGQRERALPDEIALNKFGMRPSGSKSIELRRKVLNEDGFNLVGAHKKFSAGTIPFRKLPGKCLR